MTLLVCDVDLLLEANHRAVHVVGEETWFDTPSKIVSGYGDVSVPGYSERLHHCGVGGCVYWSFGHDYSVIALEFKGRARDTAQTNAYGTIGEEPRHVE